MLIALSIFLFTLFGGTAEIRDRLEDTVSDPVRLEAALELLGGIEDLQAIAVAQIEETSAAFRVVHDDYNATREDYLAALAPLQKTRMDVATRLHQGWTKMHQILTDEEWVEVFPPAE